MVLSKRFWLSAHCHQVCVLLLLLLFRLIDCENINLFCVSVACDWRGRTPLAALADVSVSTDKEGARDASTSIESNIVDAALALLEAGASLTTPDMLGRTALHIAALRGNVKLIDTFIAKAGAKLATDLLITKDANGFTVTKNCICFKKKLIFVFFVKTTQPLHSAVIYHRVSAVTHLLSAIKLLSNDQSVDAKKRAQLSKLVECASADDDSNNTDDNTALSAPPVLLCAAMTRPAEPRAFVQRVNEATIYRSARLITDKHAAAMVKCASLLIEAGANVEARNVEGATLLHCAIQVCFLCFHFFFFFYFIVYSSHRLVQLKLSNCC